MNRQLLYFLAFLATLVGRIMGAVNLVVPASPAGGNVTMSNGVEPLNFALNGNLIARGPGIINNAYTGGASVSAITRIGSSAYESWNPLTGIQGFVVDNGGSVKSRGIILMTQNPSWNQIANDLVMFPDEMDVTHTSYGSGGVGAGIYAYGNPEFLPPPSATMAFAQYIATPIGDAGWPLAIISLARPVSDPTNSTAQLRFVMDPYGGIQMGNINVTNMGTGSGGINGHIKVTGGNVMAITLYQPTNGTYKITGGNYGFGGNTGSLWVTGNITTPTFNGGVSPLVVAASLAAVKTAVNALDVSSYGLNTTFTILIGTTPAFAETRWRLISTVTADSDTVISTATAGLKLVQIS